MLSVLELSIKSTQRLSVSKHEYKKCENIKLFGSGFLMKIKGKIRLLTADHVVHYDDYEEGRRVEDEDNVFLELNMKKGLSQLCYRLGNFQHFDIICLEKYEESRDEIEYTDFIDFAYYTFEDNKDFKETSVQEEISMFFLDESITTDFNNGDLCIVSGIIKRKVKTGGVIIGGEPHSYEDLSFVSEKDGVYTLQYPCEIIKDDWIGLSGAPVFSDKGALVGMLLEVSEHDNTVQVLSMKKIFSLVQ